jgi:hypothetical protein
MAALLAERGPPNPILVPVPSSRGDNRATEVLAEAISTFFKPTIAVWNGLVRGIPVASSFLLKRAGKRGLSASEQEKSLTLLDIPPDGNLVLVDNVCGTGHTLRGCARVLNRDVHAVVYTRATRTKKTDPDVTLRTNPALRICVSGSREYGNLENVRRFLETVPEGSVVVHGGARGVDQFAEQVCAELGITTEIHLPDWEKEGRAAGPLRNRRMVESCDALVAFWDGKSRGTASSITAARRLGKHCEIVYDEDFE